MKTTFHKFTDKLNYKALLRRGVALTLALSFFVASGGFFEISGIDDAEKYEYICNIPEHSHSDECYASIALCENTDEEHDHEDSCFATVQICPLAEHTHTDECLAHESGDLPYTDSDAAAPDADAEYNAIDGSVNNGGFTETPIPGAYADYFRVKDGIIHLAWVVDPNTNGFENQTIDNRFKNPYRNNPSAYIKIVVENGTLIDLGGFNGFTYNSDNSTWLGSAFAPIILENGSATAYYFPAKDYIQAIESIGGIDNLWGIVATGTGTVESFSLVNIDFFKEPNALYYRANDRLGNYIYGSDRGYLLCDSESIDVRPTDKLEVYAEVDTENFTFEYNSDHLRQIGSVSSEYNAELERWVMTATYKVIDVFEADAADTVTSQITLAGTNMSGESVTSTLDLTIHPGEKIELDKIYYKLEDEADYKLNDTTESDLFRMLDGGSVDVFVEIKLNTTDPEDVYPLLGSQFGFIVEGSELSLKSTVVCSLVDNEDFIWRISASYTADYISEHAKIFFRNNNNIADTLHIEIDYELNKIYYKLPGETTYRKNYGKSISVYEGDVIQLAALVENTNAKFRADDAGKFTVSEMTFEDVVVDGERYVKATATAIRITNYNQTTSIRLFIGNTPVDELKINIKEITRIHVHNMELGNMNYDYVDINTATTMLTGAFSNNSASNRYILFVGETLDLSATTAGEFTISLSDVFKSLGDAADEITPNNSAQLVESTIRLLALKPGDVAITVKNGDKESETFYVSVRYPIYIKTAMGIVHKNRHHEYLSILFAGSNSVNFIHDMNFNPVYIKNVDNYWDNRYRYWLLPGGQVELTTHTPVNGHELVCGNSDQGHSHTAECFTNSGTMPKFTQASCSITHTYDIEVISGESFIKVTADVTAPNAGDQNLNVVFNNSSDPLEIFYIYVRPNYPGGAYLQHFDIEVADGGTYTTVEVITEVDNNGNPIKRTVTEITYSTVVSAIGGCVIYNAFGTEVGRLEASEYWKHGIKGEDSQFEITSAYEVDPETGEGKEGTLANRQIPASEVKKVVFDLTLDIDPISTKRTVSVCDPDKGEWRIVTDESDPDYSAPPTLEEVGKSTINGFSAVMTDQDIVDAVNKCPDHSGGDFTLMTNNNYPSLSLSFTKRLVGEELQNNQFMFDLFEDTRKNPSGKPNFDTDVIRVGVAYNNAAGEVNFNSIDYVQKGTYTYYVTERIGVNDNITYDQTLIKVEVIIDQVDDSELNDIYVNLLGATITFYHWDDNTNAWIRDDSAHTFTNYYQVNLPMTGGAGTRQFVYIGGLITLIGFALLSSRKSSETDS